MAVLHIVSLNKEKMQQLSVWRMQDCVFIHLACTEKLLTVDPASHLYAETENCELFSDRNVVPIYAVM